MSNKFVSILGVSFINLPVENVFKLLEKVGGIMTVPSGPGLASIPDEPIYYNALINSDLVLADSGLMALVWNRISKEKINRISGLGFINHFVEAYPKNKDSKAIFLVNPNAEEQESNLKYFDSVGINIPNENNFIAPFYPKEKIEDDDLLQLIEKQKPHWVFLNIGGGTQEILGYWLRQNLSYKPAIICTGAAIAFKTGKQVQIPAIIDAMYMGWLWRVISNPKVYGRRFWEARRTAGLVWKYRDQAVYIPEINDKKSNLQKADV